jgi:hypothetical protein
MIENFLNLFRKKIIIPLVRRGIPTGQWVEIYKNDKYYKVLVREYGEPLPSQIEVEPVEENVTSKTK